MKLSLWGKETLTLVFEFNKKSSMCACIFPENSWCKYKLQSWSWARLLCYFLTNPPFSLTWINSALGSMFLSSSLMIPFSRENSPRWQLPPASQTYWCLRYTSPETERCQIDTSSNWTDLLLVLLEVREDPDTHSDCKVFLLLLHCVEWSRVWSRAGLSQPPKTVCRKTEGHAKTLFTGVCWRGFVG